MRAARAAAPACGSGVPPRARHPRTRLVFSARGGASERGVARRAFTSPSSFPDAPPPPPRDGARERGAARRAVAARASSPNAPQPPPAPIRVIYEDDDLLAVDKPCGLSFHSDDLEGVEAGTDESPAPGLLATIRAAQRNDKLAGSDYRGALHSVHRLDKVTSGITLFAKNRRTASHLGEQFRLRKVHKYYVALSARKPSKKMGTVAGEMRRARRGAWRLVRSSDAKNDGQSSKLTPGDGGSNAKTNPQVATTKFVSRGLRKPGADAEQTRALRLLVLRPLTGRTHQLRVACKSLGAPILGDAAYAGKDDARKEDRAYLHAAAVRVALPASASESRMKQNAHSRNGEDAHGGDDDASSSSVRVVAVVCKPSFGGAWSDSRAFDEAWDEAGFGAIEKGDADVWFEGQTLLRSSASELA